MKQKVDILENVDKILEDYKYSMFINISLEKFRINHVDFLEFLEKNKIYSDKYEKINQAHWHIFEEKIAQRGIVGVPKDSDRMYFSEKVVLEMIKHINKSRYQIKDIKSDDYNINEMSDEELNKKIIELQKTITFN